MWLEFKISCANKTEGLQILFFKLLTTFLLLLSLIYGTFRVHGDSAYMGRFKNRLLWETYTTTEPKNITKILFFLTGKSKSNLDFK